MRPSSIVVLALVLVSITGILSLPTAKSEEEVVPCVENCEVELVRDWISDGDDSVDQFTLVDGNIVHFEALDQNNCPEFEIKGSALVQLQGTNSGGGDFYVRLPSDYMMISHICEMTVWLPGAQLPDDQL